MEQETVRQSPKRIPLGKACRKWKFIGGLPYVGFPPAGAPVEGDATVLRAPRPRAAPALPQGRPGPRVGRRRRRDRVALLHYLLLMLPHRRLRRCHRHLRREELLGDGGRAGGRRSHREARDHSGTFPVPGTPRLLVASNNAVVDSEEGSLGGRHGAVSAMRARTDTNANTTRCSMFLAS
jgi:hypothetical protein